MHCRPAALGRNKVAEPLPLEPAAAARSPRVWLEELGKEASRVCGPFCVIFWPQSLASRPRPATCGTYVRTYFVRPNRRCGRDRRRRSDGAALSKRPEPPAGRWRALESLDVTSSRATCSVEQTKLEQTPNRHDEDAAGQDDEPHALQKPPWTEFANEGLTRMTVVELWKAVRSGDADLVRELAGEAELREAANETGYRALHMAALADSTEILRILVDAGAQVDARRDDGWTALHQCAAFGKLDMARLLLEAGAPVDAQDNDGWTPLHEASSPDAPREVAVEMTQVLLENGADVNMHKADGAAALHLVAANGDVDCGEVLLDAGAFIDDKLGPSGRTPLFVAASRGHAAFVAMLASRGADPRSMSARGHDALLSAVQGDHLQVVKVLVASGSVPKKAHLSAADRGTDQELKQFLLFATRSELAARLRSCSMERYIPDFFEHRITSLEAGRDCADGDLEKLGIAQLEHREVIIQTLSGKRSSLARLSKRLSMSFRGST